MKKRLRKAEIATEEASKEIRKGTVKKTINTDFIKSILSKYENSFQTFLFCRVTFH